MSNTIRGYELQQPPLGGGGFGIVHRAYQPVLQREVAIKVIRQEFVNEPAFIRSFESEAQLVARLENPHIVPLYDFWRDPHGAYLVMRYLRGGSLRTLIEQKQPLQPEEILRLLEHIVAALHVAHQSDIVHRDIKPDNILLDENGNAYLTDFGIAKPVGQVATHDNFSGTISHVAPEQLRGEKPHPAMDIYSLGIMLFELVTGQHPFVDLTALDMMYHHNHVMPPDVQMVHSNALAGFDAVIQKAAAKSANNRYSDVRDLLADVRTVVMGKASATKTAQVISIIPNPYKGLKPFHEADAADFFGRDVLIASMSFRLRSNQPFLAVVGPSGSGKSSLVRAGLIPTLRTDTLASDKIWFIADFQPGAKPLDALADTLNKISPVSLPDLSQRLQASEKSLVEVASTIFQEIEGVLLLVIDQFEEVFVQVEAETERTHFLNLLTYAATATASPVRIVLTLRADFYDRPLRYEGFSALIEQYTQPVLPLNSREIEQVIVAPAERVGLKVDSQLVGAIISDLREQPAALPLLQYALTEVFKRREGLVLTYGSYEDSGGISGALALGAETTYFSLDSLRQQIARQLFLRLVTHNDNSEYTRRRSRRAELYETIVPRDALDDVLEAFSKARLLTLTFNFEGSNREPMVEIAHEALIDGWGQLRDWIDASRNDIRLQRLLSSAYAEWQNNQRSPDFLLSAGRLQQFVEWLQNDAIVIPPEERNYLNLSIAQRDADTAQALAQQQRELELNRQSIRRLRQLIVGAAIFIVGVFGLTIFSYSNYRTAIASEQRAISAEYEAVQRAEEADARLLASRLPRIALSDPSLAYGLALSLLEEMDNPPLSVQGAVTDFLLTNSIIRRFEGHRGNVSHVVYSPDGTQAISVGIDALIIRWDVATGEQLQTYRLHETWVRAVAWLPDGERVITGANDGTLYLWDVTTGDILQQYEGHEWGITAVNLSPDASRMISSAADTTAIIWHITTGEIEHRLAAHESYVWNAAFAPDGQTFATVSEDAKVIVWDAATGAIIYTLTEHNAPVTAVTYSPDSQTLLVGDFNAGLFRWDVATGELRNRLVGHNTSIWRVAYSADGRYGISTAEDGEVILWDMTSGDWLARRKGHVLAATSATFAPDGRTALSTGEDGSVVLWDIASITERPRYLGHENVGTDVALAPDGLTAVSGSWDETAILWDVATQTIRYQWADFGAWISCVAYAPDGKTVVIGDWNGMLTQYDTTSGAMLQQFDVHDDRFESVEYSADSSRVITASLDGTVKVWDLATATLVQTFAGHNAPAFSATFAPDGQSALSGGEEGLMYHWEIATGTILHTFAGHSGTIMDIEYAPDGETILTASADSRLILWDVLTGEALRTFAGHVRLVETVSFAPDGQTALSSSADQTIILWDIASGDILRRLQGYDWVSAVDFAPDGLTAFSISGEGWVLRWQVLMPESELIAWARANRAITEISCTDREVYRTPQRCPAQSYQRIKSGGG
jgi:WD40 repeat protein/serine/threonine protein kinase